MCDNILDVLKINKLGHQLVSVERPLRSSDAPQCHRCQQFGHTKNYCRRPFACVKCAGTHPSTECKKDKNADPKCVNCEGRHTANYRGCQVFKDACKLKEPQYINRANVLLDELGIPRIPVTQHSRPQLQQQQSIVMVGAELSIQTAVASATYGM